MHIYVHICIYIYDARNIETRVRRKEHRDARASRQRRAFAQYRRADACVQVNRGKPAPPRGGGGFFDHNENI